MLSPSQKFKTVDDYHAMFPGHIRKLLDQMRRTIKKAAPKAEESISYNMPAFRQNGMVAFYAGYKNHIGFYPTASPIVAFKKEIKAFKTSKGAIQFLIDEPLPVKLITDIVKFKVKENQKA